MLKPSSITHTLVIGLMVGLMVTPPMPIVLAQNATPAAAPAPTTQGSDKPPLSSQEIEAIIAPIALYPDSLLAQILMASTYPLEIVQADRWVKANPNLKNDALSTELEKQSWDPSVKSLAGFPDVLAMLSDKIDLTMKIGDAFIEQQEDVMSAVQRLRAKAKAAGNLKDSKEQKVIVEQAPPPQPTENTSTVTNTTTETTIIKIEPSDPQVIYVPQYNPTVVYGSWPYPSYPPAPYYPWASAAVGFGVGLACGAAWGYAWGGCNWGGGDVDIDVNRNTNFNQNIDRTKAKQNIQNRQTNRGTGQGGRGGTAGQGGRQSFQHDPSHRKGVAYRDNATAQKYGGTSSRQAAQARDQYRGRTQGGAGTGGAGNRAGAGGAGVQNRAGAGGAQNRPGAGGSGVQNRAGAGGAQNRAGGGGSAQNRAGSSGSRSGGALNGSGQSGSAARQSSQRGQQSRSSSPSRSSPSRSSGGGSRSGGGGGSRGGGGGSRGGGGGGRR
ncbi:MAG TPA: DUF3300 domain-containing protein [Tepidisphaeraceae bacterium]|jgi:hypothetical protein